MNNFDKIKLYLLSSEFLSTVIILVLAVVFVVLINKFTKKETKMTKKNKRIAVGTRYIANIVKYLVLLFAVLTVLEINGIHVTSLLTGLGVAGIIVGFALQDILKDVIMGVNIVVDDYFAVGDIVKYNDIEGKIVALNMKATKIKDLDTQNVITVANRNISEIARVSKRFPVIIPAPYTVPAKQMREICKSICERIEELDHIEKAEFVGTDQFADSSIKYKIFVYGNPEHKLQNKRNANSAIQDVFKENNINIPYNQLDVHFDKN